MPTETSTPTLWREGTELCPLEVADTVWARTRGLLGRDHIDGALALPGVRSVHTWFLRFPIEVVSVDEGFRVVAIERMQPWRVLLPRKGARHVFEAKVGTFELNGVQVGDHLEMKDV